MFKNLLNYVWRKPESRPLHERGTRVESIDLSKLDNHFVLRVGVWHCDLCKSETRNCCKVDIVGQCLCICPRKDIKGFNRPKKEEK